MEYTAGTFHAGEAIRCIKDFTASCTSAEVLLHTAFKRLGGLPLSRLHRLRTQEAVAVQVGETSCIVLITDTN